MIQMLRSFALAATIVFSMTLFVAVLASMVIVLVMRGV
jgi:hypothetical protein